MSDKTKPNPKDAQDAAKAEASERLQMGMNEDGSFLLITIPLKYWALTHPEGDILALGAGERLKMEIKSQFTKMRQQKLQGGLKGADGRPLGVA